MSVRILTTTALFSLALSGGSALAQSAGGIGMGPCEAGFVGADANNDGTVTAEETKAATERAFNEMDADGSGDVSQEEYVDCGTMGAGTTSAMTDRSEENMAEVDANDDGTLTQQEFMQGASEAHEAASAAGSPGAQPVVILRRFVFLPAQNGSADIREMRSDQVEGAAAQQFGNLDTNRDNRLDKSEWAQQEAVKRDLSSVLNMEFSKDDKDQSGTLDMAEFREGTERRAQSSRHSGDSAANPPVVYYVYPAPM